jgi:hypothetical protein
MNKIGLQNVAALPHKLPLHRDDVAVGSLLASRKRSRQEDTVTTTTIVPGGSRPKLCQEKDGSGTETETHQLVKHISSMEEFTALMGLSKSKLVVVNFMADW